MRTVALSDYAEVFNGKTPSKAEQRESGRPVLKIRDVDEKGQFRQKYESFVDPAFAEKFAKKQIKPGDTLILNAAHNADYVGSKSFFATVEVDGAIATGEWLIVRPRSDMLDGRFASHWLTSDQARRQIRELVKGIHLYPKDVARLSIPLPSLSEQKRIAAILDQADELRRKRQRAIDRLNQLGEAIFYEMFGNISGTDTAWKVKPLADLCDLVRGSSPRPQGDPRYFGGPVPRLMIADITRDGINVTPRIDSLTEEGARKSRPMPAGSVVMAVSGAVGLPAILSVDACIHDGFVGFRKLDQSVLPEFFYWFLRVNREQNKSQGTGAIWVNLNTDQVKRFNVPVPPISLQEHFVTKMKEIAVQSDLQISNQNKIDRLFASIQNRAFQGEL